MPPKKCEKCGNKIVNPYLCNNCIAELLRMLKHTEPIIKEYFLREKQKREDDEHTMFDWKTRKSIVVKKLSPLESCAKDLNEIGNPDKYYCIADIQPKRCQITVWKNNRKQTYRCSKRVIEILREHVSYECKRFVSGYYGKILNFDINPHTNVITNVSEFPYQFEGD